ncbi:putative NBD/HSP70 family sugar kinase [Spinactinospora alkalitolerans]|uniref:Putative NBD/HSP70 family sugar kinase n=1 Tax=Spinactinospora alkalitolerans TaxID=687207 RepID=A0A852U069_9ACTN|nr:ROK family transcriptional regulator [Spinactinospora alkalitolerans]NYE48937.1 putative NBD/HSP70 family sugar kinase [Spinactinospora alkalitolerans]
MNSAGDVLDLISRGAAGTRADLARHTGMARSTVAQRVDALIEYGLVEEATEPGESTGGRPPRVLRLNTELNCVLGVDLGATHCRVALMDIGGALLATREDPLLITRGPEPVLEHIDARMHELLAEVRRPIETVKAIGIGVPGPVEFATGRPVNPPIMPGWHEYPIPEFFTDRYDVEVLVDNDVNVLALGERRFAYPEAPHLLFVKVGTGIGCGIIAGGRLHRGSQGSAGDIGHIRVPGADDALCRCGNTGCLEAVAGGTALAERLTAAGVPARTGRDVVELVNQGDPLALRMVRDGGRVIGDVLAGLVNFFNPEAIVVGGVMAEVHEPLLAGVREVIYQRSLPLATHRLAVVPSRSGDEGGALGAGRLAIDHVLAPDLINRALARRPGAPPSPRPSTAAR